MEILGPFTSILTARPKIATSPTVRLIELKSKSNPYYIVASVEVGNTTTKCIIMATDMNDGKTRHVASEIRMTRDVRHPKEGEEIFGRTLNNTPLTLQSVSELVSSTLIGAMIKAQLSIKDDLHFVVRSTGVVAGFDSPDEVGEFIKALADGCLKAGVPPRNMTPAMSIENIPKKFQKFSLMQKVIFNGAVAGVTPPVGSSGVEIVANEMEGELATAGIKEGAKWADVDFRNPCMSMDFGTTLDGRITDSGTPYAKTIGNFCGLAGAIPDAIAKGTSKVDPEVGTALEIADDNAPGNATWITKGAIIMKYAYKIHEYIRIEKIKKGASRYGTVPVDAGAAEDIGVALIGCDVGDNGSDLDRLTDIGADIYSKYGAKVMFAVIDMVMAQVISRLVSTAHELNLITEDTAIGVTGRAGITGKKPQLALYYLSRLGIYDDVVEKTVFVDDGLARGAAVMARCMNSLGSPKNPIGGCSGGKCVLAQRIKLQDG